MKKNIIAFLFVFLTFGLFAETGYSGTQWGTKKSQLPLEQVSTDTKTKTKKMMGIETSIFYHFIDNELKGISYSLPIRKAEQAKNSYTQLISVQSFTVIEKEQWIEILKSEKKLNQDFTTKDIDRESNKLLFSYAQSIEDNRASGIGKGDARIYIYNYNDDTRVYLFENMVKDVIVVVYLNHEQDY